MKNIKLYLTMFMAAVLVLFGVIAEGAITSGVPITGNYFTGIKSTESENLITNPTPYKTDTGIDAGTGMTITRATTTAAFRFQNQAYWAVQSSTQGACRSFTKRTPYGPLLNGQCMAGLMFNGDATGYSIRIENSTGSILSETPLDFVSGYTRAYTPGVTCGDNSERVVKICRTASGAGATIGVGDVFYGQHRAGQVSAISAWKPYTPTLTNFGNAVASGFEYRINGDSIDIRGRVTIGSTAPTGTLTVSIPPGMVFSTSSSVASTEGTVGGYRGQGYTGYGNRAGTNGIIVFGPSGSGSAWNATLPATWLNGDTIDYKVTGIKIQGLSAGAFLSDQFGGEPISSIARRITNQSVSSMSPTTVQLDVALKDPAGMINTTTYETTVKSSGDYDVGMGAVIVNGNIGERFTLTAYVNGVATFISTSVEGQGANSATTMTSFPAYPLVKNDKVTLVVTSNADTSYTVAFATLGLKKVTPQNYAIPFKKAPTVTRLTSGSGTYTVPQGVLYLSIEMVGGGSGGAGGGATQPAGGAGGNTTFGTSLLTATGAGASSSSGGPGGTATVNAPAITVANVIGASGQAGFANSAATSYAAGGIGASTSFGGAGTNRPAAGGVGANANTGSGGGGGSGGNAATHIGGGGGGAGGYLRAIIPTPDASYPYVVGAGGTAGAAGTSGYIGSTGGTGVIIITEHYQ